MAISCSEKQDRYPNLYLFTVVILSCLGSISFGYTNSIIASTLAQPSFILYMGLNTAHNATQLISATNGLYYAGAAIGALVYPSVSDRWGRKCGLRYACIILIVSAAFMAGSVHITMLLVFRFWSGMGAFALLMAIPIYITEISPAHIRGAMVDFHSTFFNIGFVIAAWVGYGCYRWTVTSLVQWRAPLALQAVFPLLLLLSLPSMPESPRWLITQGQNEKARLTLMRLHGRRNDDEDSFTKCEYESIKAQTERDLIIPHGWLDIFKRPSYRKRLFVAAFVNSVTQCSGILVVNAYGPIIYSMLGFDTSKQLILSGCWLIVATVTTLMAMPFVDRFSRPSFISLGLLLCAVSLSVEASIVRFYVPSENHAALNAGVAMMFVFVVVYGFFIDGCQFAYIPEVFPNHIRSKGSCFAVFCGALVDLILTQCAPTAFETITWKYYLVFIVSTTFGSLVIWLAFPDTNGRALEEIASLFGDTDELIITSRQLADTQSSKAETVAVEQEFA